MLVWFCGPSGQKLNVKVGGEDTTNVLRAHIVLLVLQTNTTHQAEHFGPITLSFIAAAMVLISTVRAQGSEGRNPLQIRFGMVWLQDGVKLCDSGIRDGSVVHPDWKSFQHDMRSSAFAYLDPDWWIQSSQQLVNGIRQLRLQSLPPFEMRMIWPGPLVLQDKTSQDK
ncbi:hypothetical protein GUITHDRAFT_115908 [Guillardia theta CCMP2712]|uniref:Uncharacterized protein n=1 Tax=Guillardia theta (strain CCMP2712) TaxID=905079 RepID=L1INS1_GUITC|nr:hypothetical protein GUITHDRAFT_115908 [Guillardia theta CCMP2712]EKX37936.1 hypothetical protein GUITHDRAFT_115908 [Guillardia theta CCMP2712]|eukprot:XP_005824916.1 hypothetical protein GUITHDRAFT_115908 [Guillardia theta CCMP2712]